jgi:hypothetical protein
MSVDELAERWTSGASATEIARATGLTRGMVLGQVHRRRKAGDSRFSPRPRSPGQTRAERLEFDRVRKARKRAGLPPPAAKPQLKARVVKPAGEEVGDRRRVPAPVEKPRAPRLLIDLGPLDCRWPVGEAPDGRHLFCGQARAPRRPYCPQCCARLSSSLAPLRARG